MSSHPPPPAAGLYDQMATPWYPSKEHRRTSLLHLLRRMGACETPPGGSSLAARLTGRLPARGGKASGKAGDSSATSAETLGESPPLARSEAVRDALQRSAALVRGRMYGLARRVRRMMRPGGRTTGRMSAVEDSLASMISMDAAVGRNAGKSGWRNGSPAEVMPADVEEVMRA